MVLAALCIAGLMPAHTALAEQPALSVTDMRVDNTADPLGIDDTTPDLSWQLASSRRDEMQSAYQVQAAGTAQDLQAGKADTWDSGRISSQQSVDVTYRGTAPASGERVYWRVRVWDGNGQASAWSAPAYWEMGLLKPADWAGARWIGAAPTPSPWPQGTVATASSFHTPNGNGGYEPALALDGDPATFWNDDTPGAYPDWLTITTSSPITLPGVTVVSQPCGVIEDYVVDTWDGTQWVRQGTVSGSDAVTRQVPFAAAVTTTQIRITVTADQPVCGNYSRIAEVYPNLAPPPPAHRPEPLLRKGFSVTKQVKDARIYVSGLGYYVLSIDGRRVGNSVLDPGLTVYDKSALYATYDVTDALRRAGPHALGVALGRGFFGLYREDTLYWGGAPWINDPRLLLKLQVDYTDGSHDTVVSNDGWQAADGPTTSDSIYMGETYDARLAQPGWDRPDFDATAWRAVAEVAAPTANLRPQTMQPIRVVGSMRAEQISSPKPGTYVFKFPVVTAGWARLRAQGPPGTKVTMRYGETLRADGTVNNDGDSGLTTGPTQTDQYVLSGHGVENWQPSFSYKGFQYIQVDGYPGTPTADDVVAEIVHTDVPSTGTFSSSNDLLNTLHSLTRRTVLNNLHSILTDSPMFEKRGWLDDANDLAATSDDNFGMDRFFANWTHDMTDNQGADGAGVDLSPNPYPAGYTDPIWAGAMVSVPWQMYQDYGDRQILESNYAAMARYVDYLTAHSNGLIQQGTYGDWASPNLSGGWNPPEGSQLTATAYFYKYAVILSQAAQVLGHGDDESRFAALAEQIKSAFNAKFLDRANGSYHTDIDAGYRQASNAVPLSFGLVPPDEVGEVTQNLVADIRARGNHLNTGEAGTKELLRALTEQGQVDTAFAVATQRSYPSWGNWVDNGATTLWERWEANPVNVPRISHDHAFMGTIDDWFYRDLAGITPAAPGYSEIALRPYVPAGLDHAAASEKTVHGTVASSWAKTGNAFHLDVTVPVNATATVYVPLFGQDQFSADAGAKLLRVQDGNAIYSVGSGQWGFISHNPPVADVAIDAPGAGAIVPPSGATTVAFTVRNLTSRTVTIHPQASVSTGFTATAQPATMTIPAAGSASVEVSVSADSDAPPGAVTLSAGGQSAQLSIERTDNWARVATMSASSALQPYDASLANDGKTSSQNGIVMWNDNTLGSFPDSLTATWDHPITLRRAVVYTLDSTDYPASGYGLRDYDVQALVAGQWHTLAAVRGNAAGKITSSFDAVTTSALRLLISDTNDHAYSRVIEFEAYEQ